MFSEGTKKHYIPVHTTHQVQNVNLLDRDAEIFKDWRIGIKRNCLIRSRIIVHEIALFIDHAPSTIDKANIKEVVDIIEVKRVPRIIKGRPGRLYRKGRW